MDKYYNGYHSANLLQRRLYNPFAIVDYLEEAISQSRIEPENLMTWSQTGYVQIFKDLLKRDIIILYTFYKLSMNQMIQFPLQHEGVTKEVIKTLRNPVTDMHKSRGMERSVVFSLLLDLGYLTFVPNSELTFKAPNKEIRKWLKKEFEKVEEKNTGIEEIFKDPNAIYILNIQELAYTEGMTIQTFMDAVLNQSCGLQRKPAEM